ncbi:YggS family pyridoxal phosphate-dependent enzyme [Paracoccus aminophilus]|uniref:Pyridoxal phosphate homeostasis protein n=1 Tax=Paracoccus aminophilus JCM 7686 TaxID=1367847 RepID=S5XX27_PARAH|nr:YggS family pyridoxal phosphate-dependent enzyme [Paracoccus aminophilus]AGT09867.1 hypothetical protein JCM7686_2811 [Paracoccus aminophilus JCM 7686]
MTKTTDTALADGDLHRPASAALTPADIDRFGPDPQRSFAANLAEVEARVAAACARAGRARGEVRLLPVTKTLPAQVMRLAYAAGIREFGENKLQEAQTKAAELADLDARWCIIGHLQSNKAKYLARFAAEFHALDSLKLAAELDRRMAAEGRDLPVWVQVNTSKEESKFGLTPEALPGFLDALGDYPRLRPQGLMTLAVFSPDPARVRPCFQLLRRLRDAAQTSHPAITGLSMGMSGDYELAIAEGATVVRVGQSIFGKRPGSDAHYWPGLIPAPPSEREQGR